MGCTLVIDTSYGSTVGIVGHEPIVETDSRTHVERLRNNIALAVERSGNTPKDIDTVIVGTGPAPFTGLRAGIVTAKALAFATGAKLIGHNILEPQAQWNLIRRGGAGSADGPKAQHVLTLAVNDARRKQLYFELCDGPLIGGGREGEPRPIIAMDIDYPASIVERVNEAVRAWRERTGGDVVVDVVGHGAGRYSDTLSAIEHAGDIVDESVLDGGEQGLSVFAGDARRAYERDPETPVEPLYLRRPDAQIPAPLKHVLNHAGAERTA
ncbi:tRNA (adenosine(37)-N6)-threonylcarbamoyltransferase complex dimerization subunit type 1 TsaB [Bifidobacterium sp. SMB2]|uniref:tRNA (Adenosine(37)-N6)-threonylcarbamoyltransferase complex dimerization subunit type 1 TsaB n=1 Tax=Bifidobacterium saimiriisciurei TaxID=2661627 RepID=A0ABX0C6S7_9BIFI|nr:MULTISPECIES: tRNA (adenosine(37)-N6)-threonylcarbamoyltransferase complex dimerization subunit type 1 TsaB [Bifidobacterium]NEG96051.1 tRNA (adenosine(37)-N6)-threonylcarbamoyltransferase complex dimerization subunit type 1 TsaB [Bifidobacterium sp. SMB2]NEH10871.1 tRNA (adenosine(37)-N6)-threonylcarbamoyltransferase complex dimerization subunit type 1 TsaB [Bifidobacterium saimiriisciurei]